MVRCSPSLGHEGAGGAEQWRTVGDGRGSHNRNELVMIYPSPRPGKQQAKGGRRQQAKAKYSRRLSCLQQVCLPSLPPLLFVRMQGREQAKVPDYIQEAERTIYMQTGIMDHVTAGLIILLLA